MSEIYDLYLEKYSPLIMKQANNCFVKLPQGYATIDDLVQEGNIVLMKVLRMRFDPKKSKFITLLTKSLMNRYQKIVRSAYTHKRYALIYSCTSDDSLPDELIDYSLIPVQESQQKTLERKEVLERIRKVDKDIANLIEVGVPQPLFIFARNAARRKSFLSGNKLKKITFSEKIINAYYGKHLRKILAAAGI